MQRQYDDVINLAARLQVLVNAMAIRLAQADLVIAQLRDANPPAVPINPLGNAPQVQIVHREALAQMRHYNGKTSITDYLKRLQADFDLMQLNTHWVLTNFDRLLDGDAKAW